MDNFYAYQKILNKFRETLADCKRFPELPKKRMKDDLIKISKFLSFALRHKPEEIGILLDKEGWTSLEELFEKAKPRGYDLNMKIVLEVVTSNDKGRFAISDDGKKIRALQGHSTNQVSITFPEKTPPEFLYHGTASRFKESILQTGLQPQERQFVHLSETRETAVQVGSRHGKPVVLKINSGRMFQKGFLFYLSENGVWLTRSVPKEFLSIDSKS